MLATAFYALLRRSGALHVARHARAAGAILCYHNVVSRESAHGAPGLHLEVQRFQRQVEWLAQRFTVIGLAEYTRRLQRGQSLRRLLAITFDDGYDGVFTHAWPILRSLGLPATVFVPTGLPPGDAFWWDGPAVLRCTTDAQRERWLTEFHGDGARITRMVPGLTGGLPGEYRLATWTQMTAAQREGCRLEAHTRTHRNLTCLGDDELRLELEGSRRALEERVGRRVTCLSYPYGRADARVRAAARRAGFEAAVTMDFGLNAAGADPLALRRINVPASIPRDAFQSWASGIRPRAAALHT